MDKQLILREAQKIAAKYSFWMVSGNIAHLFGYVYETPEKKYELEIKFDEDFPNTPPEFLFHNEIKDLLGDVQIEGLNNWTSESTTVEILHELKVKIQENLDEPVILDESFPITESININSQVQEPNKQKFSSEEYITPDLNAYPTDLTDNQYITPSNIHGNYSYNESNETSSHELSHTPLIESTNNIQETQPQKSDNLVPQEMNVPISTELGLIQQSYAYDQRGINKSDINVYLTITISNTFIIGVDFTNYPERPKIFLPDEVSSILGDPYSFLSSLKKWNPKKSPHVVDVLHELETKLFFIEDFESETKKILGEYQCDKIPNSITRLKVHLLTYGFREYLLDIDLEPYPKPPLLNLTNELKELIKVPVHDLNSLKNWEEKKSEPIEIIREISWLVDKNSRINFEIELLRDHYKDLLYDSANYSLRIDMKGKMKTEDLTFQFQIDLPREYPLKLPEIKVINEFELESHEKIKNDLQASFKSFFDQWTPFTYLVDLFDTISKKIFEVSVVSCVICHKIECPSCNNKIAGDIPCNFECPHCERPYHKHCWEQTIASFGKCGFCLRSPY